MEIPLFLFGIFILGVVVLQIVRQNRKQFPKKEKQRIEDHLEKIETLSIKEKIIELDTVLDECFKAKGYQTGTLGERMKIYKGFLNEDGIWQAHKLRNTIAHEMGFSPSAKEADEAIYNFLIEINAMMNR